jgi:hypothetical protein
VLGDAKAREIKRNAQTVDGGFGSPDILSQGCDDLNGKHR